MYVIAYSFVQRKKYIEPIKYYQRINPWHTLEKEIELGNLMHEVNFDVSCYFVESIITIFRFIVLR